MPSLPIISNESSDFEISKGSFYIKKTEFIIHVLHEF